MDNSKKWCHFANQATTFGHFAHQMTMITIGLSGNVYAASGQSAGRRITRGSPFCAPGCGQAGRPPHPVGIVGQNRCGTLRRRRNVLFCHDSYPAASTCFRDRGSGTANSAADDPRSRPGPLKRGEMSRLPVRFARSGAAIPQLTHNPGGRPRPPHRQAGQRKIRLGTAREGKPIHVSKSAGPKMKQRRSAGRKSRLYGTGCAAMSPLRP